MRNGGLFGTHLLIEAYVGKIPVRQVGHLGRGVPPIVRVAPDRPAVLDAD